MRKRILSVVFTIVLVLVLLPAAIISAAAADYTGTGTVSGTTTAVYGYQKAGSSLAKGATVFYAHKAAGDGITVGSYIVYNDELKKGTITWNDMGGGSYEVVFAPDSSTGLTVRGEARCWNAGPYTKPVLNDDGSITVVTGGTAPNYSTKYLSRDTTSWTSTYGFYASNLYYYKTTPVSYSLNHITATMTPTRFLKDTISKSDLTGLDVKAVYSSGGNNITYSANNNDIDFYIDAPGNKTLHSGTNKITITFGGKTFDLYAEKLDEPANVSLTSTPAGPVSYGTTVTLTAPSSAVSGVSYNYEWYKNGVKLSGTSSTLTLSNVADSGSYTVKIKASDGTWTTAQTESSANMVSIGKVTPTISTKPTASAVTYGQMLYLSPLSGGVASVAGAFQWTNNTTKPAVSDSGKTAYSVTFTPDDTANYATVTTDSTLVVNKKVLTPTVGTVNAREYNGNNAATGTIALSEAANSESPLATSTMTFTDTTVGENKRVNVTGISLSGTWGDNYSLSATELSDVLTTASITQKTVGLTWKGHENLVYSGNPVNVTATASGLVTGETCAVTVTGGTERNAGPHTATATALSDTNYKLPGITTQPYTIATAVLTPSVASVTGKEYDGGTTADGTIALSGAVNSEAPKATGTFAWKDKKAGTATVDVTGITLSDSWGSNYTLSTASLTGVTAPNSAKISPKALTIPAQTAVYNGAGTINVPHYSTGVSSEKIDLTYTPSAKSAGSYALGAATNGFSLALSDSNYSVGSAGDLTVSAKALTIPAKSVTYNGGTSFAETVTGEHGESVTVTYTPHAKDVNSYSYDGSGGNGKYTVTLSDSTNYSVASGGTLTVNPLPATLTWDYTDTVPFPYDKKEKSITATVSNQIGADSFTLSYTGNKGTDKGDYTATVTALGNSNYTLTGASDVTKNWAIAAQKVAKPTADAKVFTYTGSEQTYTIASNALYTVKNDKRTNAGSQDVTVSINDKSNYTWADGKTEDLTYTFAIAKAPITFVVSGNSYTYDAKSKTATAAQTAGQAPAIAKDKFSVSYQKSGEASAAADKTDADSYDVMVTMNDDNFMFAGQADTIRTGKVGTLTIGKKSITALWKNLQNVYDGKKKSADFALTGVESGDSSSVSAQVSGGEQTNVGFHSVTADLTGSRAGNYTLTNPTGTLVIQKAPVIFTVSGDMVKHDGLTKTANVTATANNAPFMNFTVTYLKDNKVVETPSDLGSYDIYAKVTNTNYRHVDGTDGTARKIGVLNIFKDTAPATYTLSFAPGEGGSGAMTALSAAQAGTARALPLCTFTKSDAAFAGWQYNGKTYQPGQVLEQPRDNSTLTALWSKNTYAISGVVDQNGNPAADAVVTLMLGSRQMGETVTKSDGSYSFATLAPGLYNLVVSKNGVTQTVKVELIASNAEGQKIILPVGKTNSVVSVASGAPAIVVGNLEKTFDKVGTVFSQTDKDTVTGGGAVEIKFTAQVKAKDAANAEQTTIAAKASGTTVELYLDMTLSKTVTPMGAKATTTPVPVSDVLLESVIPLPAALQGKQIYTVYRLHAGKVDTLTTTPNPNGEYIAVSSDKTTLTLYTKNFSTYAIAWSSRSSGGGGSFESGYPINLDTAGITGGSIKSDKANAALGAKVTITVIPNAGYKLAKLGITDKDGKTIPYQDHGDGTYAFTMPSGKVNVTPVFEKTDSTFPFVDVTEGHWARKAIEWAYGKQLFAGTTQNTFAPNAATTRGMIVTVLFRMEGSPAGFEKATFRDVAADSYCANALGWGSKYGVIKGYTSEKYGPEDSITREQMVAILYRYAELKNYDLNKTTALDKFTDGKQTAEYAEKAMRWAIANDLFSGKGDGMLDPTGKATRAEVATMLMRFNASFGK